MTLKVRWPSWLALPWRPYRGAAAVFLCSEQAGFITGQVIGVNGGWYI